MKAGAWLYIAPDELSKSQEAHLKAQLTVQNAEFVSRQKQGFSTEGIQRFEQIFEEVKGGGLLVPRGLASKFKERFEIDNSGISDGFPVDFKSKIKLKTSPENQETFVAKLFTAVKESYGAIGQAEPGFGKAQPLDADIITPTGIRKMGDIRVGDDVIGEDGKAHRVAGVFPQGMLPAYRVIFDDNSSMECNDEHLFAVQTKNDRFRKKPYRVMTLKDIMAKGLKQPCGDSKWYVPITAPVEFLEQEVPLDPYLLGQLLADGGLTVASSVKLTLHEPDVQEKVRSVLPDDCELRHSDNYDYNVTRRVPVGRNSVLVACEKLGIAGKGSLEKFIPDMYEYNSIAIRTRLLQGLFDGDGYMKNRCIEYSTSSSRLKDDVTFLVQSLGGTVGTSKRKTSCADSYRISFALPNDIVFFSSAKHQQNFIPRSKYGVSRKIVAVEPCGTKEMQCLMIDSDSHLYLTNDCLVTHNTICSLEIAARLGVTTYVVVHKEFLMNQWRDRIKACFDIHEEDIGYIQQDRCDYEGKKIVLCMVHSLCMREYDDKLYSYPGLVIFDEVHRMGAPMFRESIVKFPARYRLGVSATPKRSDGLQAVFFSHIGEVAAIGEKRKLKPKIQVVKTQLRPVPEQAFWDYRKKVSLNKVVSHLITQTERNQLIVRLIMKAVAAGRKIFVFSERREHLNTLDVLLDRYMTVEKVRFTKGFYVGGMNEKQRTISATRDVILATYSQAREGLDIEDTDTLFITTPVREVEQLGGRILRECETKKEPMIVDFVDDSIGIAKGMHLARLKEYRRMGWM